MARLVCTIITLLLAAPPLAAESVFYGSVRIDVQRPPEVKCRHGYAEYQFTITNSSNREQMVRLALPAESYGDAAVQVSRTVNVGAGASATVCLYRPAIGGSHGRDIAVYVNDRKQDSIPARFDFHDSSSGGYWRSGPQSFCAVLTSRDCRGIGNSSSTPLNIGTSELDIANWSTNWLGYSRYDLVVVSAREWQRAPAQVRAAVLDNVSCGGVLLIRGQVPPQDDWTLARETNGLFTYSAGFGLVAVATGRAEASDLDSSLVQSVYRTYQPFAGNMSVESAHNVMPVVEKLGVPVKGMLVLMLVFVLVIGPLNIMVLSAKQRRIWLLWTVPAISLLTCGLVFGYSVISEGFSGRHRIAAITLLDENTHKATSIGYAAYYSPLTPSQGLVFDGDIELTPQSGERDESYYYHGRSRGGSSMARSCRIDWTQNQHFAAGWLQSRIPAYLKFRRCQMRRERLNLQNEDGRLTGVNGLGAPIRRLLICDNSGSFYQATDIAAGASFQPQPFDAASELRSSAGTSGFDDSYDTPPQSVVSIEGSTLRGIYTSDWIRLADTDNNMGIRSFLRPGTYIAIMDESPFVENALTGADPYKCQGIVYGIMKK